MNKKTKLVIMGIVLAIIIIVCLIVILNRNNDDESNYIEYINDDTFYDDEKAVVIENLTDLYSKYKGNVEQATLEKSLWYLTNVEINKITTLKNIENYYNSNSEMLELGLGIENIDDFNSFVNYIKTSNINNFNLERVGIYLDTIQQNSGSITFDIYVQFENHDKLVFKTTLHNAYKPFCNNLEYSVESDEVISSLDVRNRTAASENNNETITSSQEIDFTGRIN